MSGIKWNWRWMWIKALFSPTNMYHVMTGIIPPTLCHSLSLCACLYASCVLCCMTSERAAVPQWKQSTYIYKYNRAKSIRGNASGPLATKIKKLSICLSLLCSFWVQAKRLIGYGTHYLYNSIIMHDFVFFLKKDTLRWKRMTLNLWMNGKWLIM